MILEKAMACEVSSPMIPMFREFKFFLFNKGYKLLWSQTPMVLWTEADTNFRLFIMDVLSLPEFTKIDPMVQFSLCPLTEDPDAGNI